MRALASLTEDRSRSCMEARDIAQHHLAAVRAKLAELKALERDMAALVERCDASCAGGPGPDCVIWDDIAAPATYAISPRRRSAPRHEGRNP